jgi:hypothetical protein
MWTKIETFPYSLTYNRYHQAQWRTCAWCNAIALEMVSRTSSLTDNTYTDAACEYHIRPWKKDPAWESKA